MAVERYHDSGDVGLRLAVVRTESDGADSPRLAKNEMSLESIRRGIAQAQRSDESAWLDWVEDSSPVDVVLRIADRHAALFPATGLTLRGESAGSVANPLRGGWGPIDLNHPQADQQLARFLRQISLSRNLIRLAGSHLASSSVDGQVQLRLVHVKVDPQVGVVDDGEWKIDADGTMAMRSGEFYGLRVTNPTAAPLYATVLIIGSNLDVQIAFPKQAGVGLVDEQLLLPGQSRLSDGFACDDVVGERWAVALATSKPHDLTYIAQDELPRVRGAVSAFDRMLQSYTVKRTRGDQRLGAASAPLAWSSDTLRWEARP
jgi:hypothetical protein